MTYEITLLCSSTPQEMKGCLQPLYDHSNLAGTFSCLQVGQTVVLTFHRDKGEDEDVLLSRGMLLTVESAIAQLYRELREAYDSIDLAQNPELKGTKHMVLGLRTALREGRAGVEGLERAHPAIDVATVGEVHGLGSLLYAVTNPAGRFHLVRAESVNEAETFAAEVDPLNPHLNSDGAYTARLVAVVHQE